MITIVPMAAQGDVAEPFVYDAWAKSLADALGDAVDHRELAHVLAMRCGRAELVGLARRYAHERITDPASRVFVATAPDDHRLLLLGFICAEPDRVHYVYVKKRLRERGVCRQLLQHARLELGPFTRVSTLTRHWTHGYAERLHLIYDPSIRSPHAEAEDRDARQA